MDLYYLVFDQIYQAIKQGKFDETTIRLKKIDRDNPVHYYESLILRSRLVEILGRVHITQGLDLLSEARVIKAKDTDWYLDGIYHISHAHVLFKKGEYHQSMDELIRAEELIGSSRSSQDLSASIRESPVSAATISFWKAELFILKGILMGWSQSLYLSDFEESYRCLQQGHQLAQQISYFYQICNSLNWQSLFHLYRGDLDTAAKTIDQSLSVSKPRSLLHTIGSAYLLKGSYYWLQSEYETALEWYQQGREVARSAGNVWLEASSHSFTGSIQFLKGDLADAHESLRRASALFTSIGDMHYLVFNNLELGDVYLQQGRIEEALIVFGEALAFFSRIDDKVCKNRTRLKLAKTYQLQNLNKVALNYYDKTISFEQLKKGIPITIYIWFYCEAFYNSVLISISQDDLKKAEEYLSHLKQINSTNSNRRIEYTIDVCQGLVYSGKNQILKAKDMFEKFLRRDIIDHKMHSVAIINYIDLLLHSEELLPDRTSLERIDELLSELEDLANTQDNVSLYLEIQVIKSSLYLVLSNIGTAADILDKSLVQAKTHKLVDLQNKIEAEIERLNQIKAKSPEVDEDYQSEDDLEHEAIRYLQLLSKLMKSKYM